MNLTENILISNMFYCFFSSILYDKHDSVCRVTHKDETTMTPGAPNPKQAGGGGIWLTL